MKYNIMRELNVNEIEKINGGIPLLIAIPAAYVVRKYGARIAVGAIGVALGWMSE